MAELGGEPHPTLTVCSLWVKAVAECLNVLISVEMVKGVLQGKDVHVGQQHRHTQGQEFLCTMRGGGMEVEQGGEGPAIVLCMG